MIKGNKISEVVPNLLPVCSFLQNKATAPSSGQLQSHPYQSNEIDLQRCYDAKRIMKFTINVRWKVTQIIPEFGLADVTSFMLSGELVACAHRDK